MRVLDIGANVGAWARAFKEEHSDAEIVCIEANPECAPALKESGFPYHIALLYREAGPLVFWQRKQGGTSTGDSVYRELTPWYDDENAKNVVVQATTLADLLPGQWFDYIKIDCQGAELDIMRGGRDIVRQAAHIQLEVPMDGVEYNHGAPTRRQYMDFMHRLGFVAKEVLDSIPHPITRDIIQQDILFERKA